MRSMTRGIVFGVGMLLLVGLVACEEGTFEPQVFGSINGIVLDAETEEPVAGTSVSTNPPTSAIITDDEGRFEFNEIETGSYSISVKKSGYRTASVSVVVREDRTTDATIFLKPDGGNSTTPGKAADPQPEHQSTGNAIPVTLSWTMDNNEEVPLVTFDVYLFESSMAAEKKIVSGITDTSVTVEDLRYSTSYFWQVVAIAEDGQETNGPVWSFETRAFPDHRIVFTSRRNGNYEIYSTHPDSLAEEVIQLTNNNFRDISPRYDDRRERIAFISDRDNRFQIYVMNSDGSNQRRVTSVPVAGYHNNGIGIDWAHDGGHLIYPHYERLYRIDPDGSNRQLIATAPDGRHFRELSYNYNGSRIVALTMGSTIHDSEVYVMNADGSDMTFIFGNRPGIVESPSFSPDGQQVMFTYDTSDHQDVAGRQLSTNIYIVNIDGSDTLNVSQHKPDGTNDTRPRFSPDGSRIVFENSPNDGSRPRDIYITRSDGTRFETGVTHHRFKVTTNGEMPHWR